MILPARKLVKLQYYIVQESYNSIGRPITTVTLVYRKYIFFTKKEKIIFERIKKTDNLYYKQESEKELCEQLSIWAKRTLKIYDIGQ